MFLRKGTESGITNKKDDFFGRRIKGKKICFLDGGLWGMEGWRWGKE
jgi:hypothetical protein